MSDATLLMFALTFPVGVTAGFFIQVWFGKHPVSCGAALAAFATMLGIVFSVHLIGDIMPISTMLVISILLLLIIPAMVIGACVATILAPVKKPLE